ncbi:hypothetical protein BDW22DRAFT_1364391 [Trametopsis cervina]|nr:hypothetical protein BDW22DRAFT_1364391 [Trametopsis cervina]
MGSPASVAHGPALLGIMLNILLYGVMLMQCFMYFSRFPKDRPWIRFLVLLLLFGDTVNSVFLIIWIYDILILHFGDIDALATGNWVFSTEPAMTGTLATIVQLFFAWRIMRLTNNFWVTTLIVITALTSAVGGVGTAISIHFTKEFAHFQDFKVIVIVWLIGAAICDLSITIMLTTHLRRHKTGFSRTDSVLNKIIRVTVSNGLLTSVWAIIDLIVYLATPTGLHLVFNVPLAKLYTNSLMSTLNSRIDPADIMSTSEDSGIHKRSRGNSSATRRRGVVDLTTTSTNPGVFVHVETHEMADTPKPDPEWSQQHSEEFSQTQKRESNI